MAAISAVVVPVPGYVYVEANFASTPGATYACVDRVDTLTGARSPLRPYVSYSTSGCLALSCGQGIWWDTEAPLDRAIYYCATAQDASGNTITQPAANLVTDTFTRTVAAGGWGTADSGQVWTTSGGAGTDFSVNGSRGLISMNNTNVSRRGIIDGPQQNVEISAYLVPGVVATGAPIGMGVIARQVTGSDYIAEVSFDLAGAMNLRIRKNIAGVVTTLSTTALTGTYTATTVMQIVFRVWGSTLSARAWDATTPDPVTMQSTVTDTSLTAAGAVGTRSIRETGNTNGTITVQFDNFIVSDVCADPVVVQVCSPEVVVPSGGCFRLGDPVRPCHDQTVCLSGDDNCVPGRGIYFANMSTETYGDNSGQLLPVNSRRPIVVSRTRRDVQSTLTVVTATFPDRDDVLLLNEPGSPLLWRGPASYGIPDRYMSVLDVSVDRSFSDHQEEPRVITMPHWAVDSPVGPSTGVCGARVEDLCDVYASWDAMVTAGLTYADLLRGKGGTGVSVDLVTWSEVNAFYANWTAVNATEVNWDDVLRDLG